MLYLPLGRRAGPSWTGQLLPGAGLFETVSMLCDAWVKGETITIGYLLCRKPPVTFSPLCGKGSRCLPRNRGKRSGYRCLALWNPSSITPLSENSHCT